MLKKHLITAVLAMAMAGCIANAPTAPEKPLVKAEPISTEISGVFKVDPATTVVRWEGKKILVPTKHTGLIAVQKGEFKIEKGMVKSGSVTLNMKSITNDDQQGDMREKLEGHLKSADFFDVEKFPTAVLSIKSSKVLEGNEIQMTGKLTIKGVEKPVEFKTTASIENGTLKAHATLEIDRTLWNIRYGSGKFFEDLGDKIIDDKINFIIDIVANLK